MVGIYILKSRIWAQIILMAHGLTSTCKHNSWENLSIESSDLMRFTQYCDAADYGL